MKKDEKEVPMALSYEHCKKIQEMLEDYDDLRELRRVKEESKGQKPIPFEKAVKSLGSKK